MRVHRPGEVLGLDESQKGAGAVGAPLLDQQRSHPRDDALTAAKGVTHRPPRSTPALREDAPVPARSPQGVKGALARAIVSPPASA